MANDLKLQQFPPNMGELPIDFQNPNKCLLTGAFEEQVVVKGISRTFITYLAPELENCRQCIVVAPPSNVDALEYLQSSGWQTLADEQKLFVHLLVPQNGSWDSTGTDADYMNAIYSRIQARDYYVTMQDNIYAFGIGDGAVIAQQAAMKMTSEWSGLATIGDLNAGAFRFMEVSSVSQEQGNLELMVEAAKCQLPVWMAFNEFTPENQKVLAYWQQQNHTTCQSVVGEGADFIWMPSQVRTVSEVNDEQIAQVRVTLGQSAGTTQLIRTMWKYVGAARRHRRFGGKILRYYKDPIACGATLHTMEQEGFTRCWYEYVPKSCTGNEPRPLVVVMHGRGGTADTFFDISGMSCVAEARGFIAVFPQAGVYQQKPGGLRNVLLWDGIYDGKPVDDVQFIRSLVADVGNRIQIDNSRVYACGQSSGGMMASTLGYYASDIFAAVATWSGMWMEAERNLFRDKTTPQDIPYMFIYGSNDFLCAGKAPDPELPFSVSEAIRPRITEIMARYGLKSENIQSWSCPPITWYGFPNASGVPMLTVGVVNNMVHANYPEESWISYDQFMCRFRRDADGTLFYQGNPV